MDAGSIPNPASLSRGAENNERRNAQLVPASSESDLFSLPWVIAFLAKIMTYLINGLGISEQVEAEATADQAVELDIELALAYYNRANFRYEQNDLDGALADYKQAIQLNPQLTFAYIHRGNVYYEQGQLDRAKADYNKAIECDPDIALGYCNRGNICSERGDYEQALADYQQALALDFKLVLVYWGRGLLQWKMGNSEAALADFYRYLELHPNADNREMFEEWITELEAELVEE